MKIFILHPYIWLGVGIAIIFTVLCVIQVLFIRFNGSTVPVPEISREPLKLGQGEAVNYVVVGDSTAVGQGGDYKDGIAIGTTEHLAKSNEVTMQNYAVSGAVIQEVLNEQLPKITVAPDVVLVAVGANDVTHLTSLTDMERDAKKIIDELRVKNPDVAIVFTGSPQMGSVPRLPQPTRWFAGVRTGAVNRMFDRVADEKKIVRAPLAEETGEIFARTPNFFAEDNFHPTGEGYQVWVPVLNNSLDTAKR